VKLAHTTLLGLCAAGVCSGQPLSDLPCRLCIELILLFCPRYYDGKGVLLEVCNQVGGSRPPLTDT
jgi:hypothetical protein